MLGLLDGDEEWSAALWRLPEDNPTRALNGAGAREFLQSAGTAQRLSIEMMRREQRGDDGYCLYAVGKPGAPGPEPTTISWQDRSIQVATNEVYTAEEAAVIYAYYRKHNTVPPDATLRLIDTFPDDDVGGI